MCFCALALPCTTCFFRANCQSLCCRCVNDECNACDFLAREDWRDICCCLTEEERLSACDVCVWYRVLCCVGYGDAVVPQSESKEESATEPAIPVPQRM